MYCPISGQRSVPSPDLALDLWTVLVDKRAVKGLTERVGVLKAPLNSVKTKIRLIVKSKLLSIPMYLSFVSITNYTQYYVSFVSKFGRK